MLTVQQTADLLRSFDNILILTHVRPDGDMERFYRRLAHERKRL